MVRLNVHMAVPHRTRQRIFCGCHVFGRSYRGVGFPLHPGSQGPGTSARISPTRSMHKHKHTQMIHIRFLPSHGAVRLVTKQHYMITYCNRYTGLLLDTGSQNHILWPWPSDVRLLVTALLQRNFGQNQQNHPMEGRTFRSFLMTKCLGLSHFGMHFQILGGCVRTDDFGAYYVAKTC